METSDRAHKFPCDFGKDFVNGHSLSSRSRGRRVTDGTGNLSGHRSTIRGPRRRFRWEASGLATPRVEWKSDGAVSGAAAPAGGEGIRQVRGGIVEGVSARKLAARMWRLAEGFNSGGGGMTRQGRFNRLRFGLQPLLSICKSAMKGGSDWELAGLKTPSANEVCQFHSNGRLVTSHQIATISVASALQVELVRSQNRVKELESERHLVKKKIKQFLKGHSEEKESSKRSKRQMVQKINDLKVELQKERKNYQKMDLVNSKLLTDLTHAKLAAKQFKQEYEKEKNARELLEDICHDLGNDIKDHKAKIRAIKVECAKILEEVEEERQMLQIAEVWREERVQMKLIDAELILEEKYCQMNNLIADLENLLRTNGTTPEMIKMREVEGMNLEMQSFSVQDREELRYMPPTVNDIHTITENLQDGGTMETGSHECQSYLSDTHSTKFHNASCEANEFTKDRSIDHDRSSANASFRKILTCSMDQYSSHTLGDGTNSVDGISGGRYVSSLTIHNIQNANQQSLNCTINNFTSMEKDKNKGPSVRKFWRSTPSVADVLRTISVDENRRPSNGSNSSNVAVSPENFSEEAVNHNELVGHCCLPGQRNPHVTRAMRGYIEWPRGIQRNGLKARPLEPSLESQKKQLRNVLKQRIE
ncbi:uncharacterized protein [Coffea arabica]|uniref:Uncharacterized protein isoform X1 n=1 Tax=Coffea arabica TaxID=13443 RepID=A0ABM4VPE0_COFAR